MLNAAYTKQFTNAFAFNPTGTLIVPVWQNGAIRQAPLNSQTAAQAHHEAVKRAVRSLPEDGSAYPVPFGEYDRLQGYVAWKPSTKPQNITNRIDFGNSDPDRSVYVLQTPAVAGNVFPALEHRSVNDPLGTYVVQGTQMGTTAKNSGAALNCLVVGGSLMLFEDFLYGEGFRSKSVLNGSSLERRLFGQLFSLAGAGLDGLVWADAGLRISLDLYLSSYPEESRVGDLKLSLLRQDGATAAEFTFNPSDADQIVKARQRMKELLRQEPGLSVRIENQNPSGTEGADSGFDSQFSADAKMSVASRARLDHRTDLSLFVGLFNYANGKIPAHAPEILVKQAG